MTWYRQTQPAGRHASPQVGLASRDRVARSLKQVRPHRVEAVRVRYLVVRVEFAEQGEPGLRAV